MMSDQPNPSLPSAIAIDDALRGSGPLARLRERVDGSNRRFASIRELLPDTLRTSISPGPLDQETWTLVAAHAAAAAKLRQLVPTIERRLAESGFADGCSVRVHIGR
jgi:hypothetical protein